MKTICAVLAIVLCASWAVGQDATTPAFKEVALDALDALNRVECMPSLADPPESATWLDAKKAMDKADRKSKSAADKNVMRLLRADDVFQVVAALDTEMWRSDYENHEQCSYEIRVALDDRLDETCVC